MKMRALALLLAPLLAGAPRGCPEGSLMDCLHVCLDDAADYGFGFCSELCQGRCGGAGQAAGGASRRRMAVDLQTQAAKNQCLVSTVQDVIQDFRQEFQALKDANVVSRLQIVEGWLAQAADKVFVPTEEPTTHPTLSPVLPIVFQLNQGDQAAFWEISNGGWTAKRIGGNDWETLALSYYLPPSSGTMKYVFTVEAHSNQHVMFGAIPFGWTGFSGHMGEQASWNWFRHPNNNCRYVYNNFPSGSWQGPGGLDVWHQPGETNCIAVADKIIVTLDSDGREIRLEHLGHDGYNDVISWINIDWPADGITAAIAPHEPGQQYTLVEGTEEPSL